MQRNEHWKRKQNKRMLMQHSKKAEAYMETDTLWSCVVLNTWRPFGSNNMLFCPLIERLLAPKMVLKTKEAGGARKDASCFSLSVASAFVCWVFFFQRSFLCMLTVVSIVSYELFQQLLWRKTLVVLSKNKIRQKAFVVFCRATMGNFKKTLLVGFSN